MSQFPAVFAVAPGRHFVQEYGSLRLYNLMMRSFVGSLSVRITRLPRSIALHGFINRSPAIGLS
jgi:hypothetical protein